MGQRLLHVACACLFLTNYRRLPNPPSEDPLTERWGPSPFAVSPEELWDYCSPQSTEERCSEFPGQTLQCLSLRPPPQLCIYSGNPSCVGARSQGEDPCRCRASSADSSPSPRINEPSPPGPQMSPDFILYPQVQVFHWRQASPNLQTPWATNRSLFFITKFWANL